MINRSELIDQVNAQADQASSGRGRAIKQIPYVPVYSNGLQKKIQRQNIESESAVERLSHLELFLEQ